LGLESNDFLKKVFSHFEFMQNTPSLVDSVLLSTLQSS